MLSPGYTVSRYYYGVDLVIRALYESMLIVETTMLKHSLPAAIDRRHILLGGIAIGLVIGTGTDNQADTFWSGIIDDVRIYNRVVEP